MSLNLGILVTGAPPAELGDRFADYGTMIASLLQERDSALRCTSYDIRALQFPPSIDAHDGYLISGSRHAAYDDLPWIHRLAAFVRELDAQRKPLVGICFGHQLIAQALGGRVRQAEQGWGVGVHHARLEAQVPWLASNGDDFALVASHQDQVVELPPRAEKLAGSTFCPIAMYRVDRHIFAMQAHPEFSREYSRALMTLRRTVIDAERIEAGMRSLDEDVDRARVADWILAFFRQAQRQSSDREPAH
jgi:GMP synthase-like glutamine amidotransferase